MFFIYFTGLWLSLYVLHFYNLVLQVQHIDSTLNELLLIKSNYKIPIPKQCYVP
jgi:hypothetical protein